MTITVYTFEDADGDAFGTYTTQDYREARDHARRYGLRLIANEFEFSESYEVEDYTPQAIDPLEEVEDAEFETA